MSDDPTASDPTQAALPSDPVPPEPEPSATRPPDAEAAVPPPVEPQAEPVSPLPLRAGAAVRTVTAVAIVFVATLVLLLGATRLIEPAGTGPTPSPSVAVVPSASPNPQASSSPSPAPSGSASAAPSGSAASSAAPSAAPSGSLAPGQTPIPTPDPVLVGAGDIGLCGSNGAAATATLLDGIAGTVFTAGDNAYESGTADQFRDCYDPTWGRHRARTRPAPGNHDWATAGLAGYFGYFGDAAKGPGGSSWYAYDLGKWHVIVLDSMCDNVGGCGPASPQGQWLAADLAASRATCTLAIFHHPRFTSGEHGDLPAMDAFWRPLYAAGVEVIVNGHDHDYERFAPQDPDGRKDSERGIREFIVGTGGAQLRKFVRTAPNTVLRVSEVYGVIAFTLHDHSYEWQFTAADNDFRDHGTENCH